MSTITAIICVLQWRRGTHYMSRTLQLEVLVGWCAGRTQQQGGRADSASQTDEPAVSEEEFRGVEEWFREWRRQRSSSDNSSNNSSSGSNSDASPGTTSRASDSVQSQASSATGAESDMAASSPSSAATGVPRTPASSPADSTASDTDSESGGAPTGTDMTSVSMCLRNSSCAGSVLTAQRTQVLCFSMCSAQGEIVICLYMQDRMQLSRSRWQTQSSRARRQSRQML